MVFLVPTDLDPFAQIDSAKAFEMIADAEAIATLAAPCLATPDTLTDLQTSAVRAVLRGAILRWNEAGTGALTQTNQSAGPWAVGQSYDTRQQRRAMFWPSEITQLQNICGGTDSSGAFSVDTVPACTLVHADICAANFGAAYCSCGATLTGSFPLYET